MTTVGTPMATGGGAARKPVAPMGPGGFQIRGIADPQKNRFIKALFYGPAGMGKTTLAGSSVDLEQMRDVLLLSSEGGDLVLLDNDRIKRADEIDEIRILRIEQLQKAYEFLQVHCRHRDSGNVDALRSLQGMVFGVDPKDIPDEEVRKYKTVIIDSLTEIESMNLGKVMGFNETTAWESGDEMPVAGFAEFRKNNNTIQAIVRAFRDLPVNLIIICGQSYTQDELKKMHFTPWLTGKLATQIQSFVDLVGYMIVSTADPNKPDLRRLYIQPQAGVRFDAKNRRASYKQAYFDDPTMSTIMKALKLIET